jgi:hypothetical protein
LTRITPKRKGQYLHDMRDGRMTPAREVIRHHLNKKHTMGIPTADENRRNVDLTGLESAGSTITRVRMTVLNDDETECKRKMIPGRGEKMSRLDDGNNSFHMDESGASTYPSRADSDIFLILRTVAGKEIFTVMEG